MFFGQKPMNIAYRPMNISSVNRRLYPTNISSRTYDHISIRADERNESMFGGVMSSMNIRGTASQGHMALNRRTYAL
jgi:hypothetical protein